MAVRRLVQDAELILPGPIQTHFPRVTVLSTHLNRAKRLRVTLQDGSGERVMLHYFETAYLYPNYAFPFVMNETTMDLCEHGDMAYVDRKRPFFVHQNCREVVTGPCYIVRGRGFDTRFVRVVTLNGDADRWVGFEEWAARNFEDDPHPPKLLAHQAMVRNGPVFAYCEDPDARMRDTKLSMCRMVWG